MNKPSFLILSCLVLQSFVLAAQKPDISVKRSGNFVQNTHNGDVVFFSSHFWLHELNENAPSPQWVLPNGLAAVQGENELLPKKQWKDLRTKRLQYPLKQFAEVESQKKLTLQNDYLY